MRILDFARPDKWEQRVSVPNRIIEIIGNPRITVNPAII